MCPRPLALLPLALAAACATPRPPPPLRGSPTPAPAPAAWIRYEVEAGPGAEVLDVEVTLPPGPARSFRVDEGVDPFVRDVVFTASGASRPLAAEGPLWRAPPCPAGCRIRYRFLLAEAADSVDEVSTAAERHGAFLAPASTWLLRPTGGIGDPDAVRFRLRVTTPPGLRFVTGLFRSAADPSFFEASLSDLPRAPYAAFGALSVIEIPEGGGVVELAVVPGPLDVEQGSLRRWAHGAARSLAVYYGRLPFPRALVIALPTSGSGPGFSTAMGNGGASVIARVGRHSSEEDLLQSWELTHELVHLAFPNLHQRHSWLEEGLATYVEPIARARAGLISRDQVWRRFAWGMPKGLPDEGDGGLDGTPSWGRLYWGGALFCLVADVEIRKRTGNARSLDDALRAVVEAGGDVSVRWPIEQVIAEGDRATGVPVLAEMYERWKDQPVDVDLDGLWRELGLRFERRQVVYDPGAPLAAIRDAITAPPGARPP